MNQNRTPATLISPAIVVSLLVVVLTACSTGSPSPSPSASAVSPAASAPAASPSSPAASPSTKPASAEEQAYQKALENWKKVVEAAQKEGPATLYAIGDLDYLKALEDGFNKVDPKIQIKIVRMTGPVATERFKGEASTKQYVGNAYFGGSPSTRPMAEQGLAQMVDDLPVLFEPGAKWLVPVLFDKPGVTLTYGFTKYFILYNTNQVPAGQEPKTWKDLGDPRYKDKLSIWDPRLAGNGQAVLGALYLAPDYGPDVVRKIVENLRVAPDNTAVGRQVAQGDMALGIVTWGTYVPIKDAPVKMVTPSDGTISTPLQAIVVKNAPQINATKVYLNWLLGKEGQRVHSASQSTNRTDVDAIAKETQIVGEKFLPNNPPTWEFEMTKMRDVIKVFSKSIDDLGK